MSDTIYRLYSFINFICLCPTGITKQHKAMQDCDNAHSCKQLAEALQRSEEERKQLKEVQKIQRCRKLTKSCNALRGTANLLAKHRQNCSEKLLPAAITMTEYVVAIVGTTAATVVAAAATGILVVAAPFTSGITGILATSTGAAAVAIAGGGGVGADRVRVKNKEAQDESDRNAQDWMRRDHELCVDVLEGAIAYEESWHEMREMFVDENSMCAYLTRQGLDQLSEIQKRFHTMSAEVVQKWRDQNFDPTNEAAMRGGEARTRSALQQFLEYPNGQQNFSTVTLFLDYAEITDLIKQYATEKKITPPVQELLQKIASDLKADAEPLQHFSELRELKMNEHDPIVIFQNATDQDPSTHNDQ